MGAANLAAKVKRTDWRDVDNRNKRKGNFWRVALPELTEGSVQSKTRPCVIVQSNYGAQSPVFMVAPLSSEFRDSSYPFLQEIKLLEDSQIHYEQIQTVSRRQLIKHLGEMTPAQKLEMDMRLAVPLDLTKTSILHFNRIEICDSYVPLSGERTFKGRAHMTLFKKKFKFTEQEFVDYFGEDCRPYLFADYATLEEFLERLQGLKFLYYFIDRE